MKRVVTMDRSQRLSRSMPHLLPQSYLPYRALSTRWAQRPQRHPPRHYYIGGVRTTLIGASSYPNVYRYPQRLIVCGAGGSFQRMVRSSSVLELSRSGVYCSMDTGVRTPRRTVSCEDVSRGRHTPSHGRRTPASWDCQFSESGVSLNDSGTEGGSVVGCGEDGDAGSLCSLGSSSAFHEVIGDSALELLDSDALSTPAGSLCGLDHTQTEDGWAGVERLVDSPDVALCGRRSSKRPYWIGLEDEGCLYGGEGCEKMGVSGTVSRSDGSTSSVADRAGQDLNSDRHDLNGRRHDLNGRRHDLNSGINSRGGPLSAACPSASDAKRVKDTSENLVNSLAGNTGQSPIPTYRPRCTPFDPLARLSKDHHKNIPIHYPTRAPLSSLPVCQTDGKTECGKARCGITETFCNDSKRHADCTESEEQQVCISASSHNDCKHPLPTAGDLSKPNPSTLAQQRSSPESSSSALISKRRVLNTQQQQQQLQQQQLPSSNSADTHHRVSQWVRLLELGPIVKIPSHQCDRKLEKGEDGLTSGREKSNDVKNEQFAEARDSQSGSGVSASPTGVVTQVGKQGGGGGVVETDSPTPTTIPDLLRGGGGKQKQLHSCDEERTIIPPLSFFTQHSSKKPARFFPSSALAAGGEEEKNNVDKNGVRNGSGSRGERDCVKNRENECLLTQSATTQQRLAKNCSVSDGNNIIVGGVKVLRDGDLKPARETPPVSDPTTPRLCCASSSRESVVNLVGKGRTADSAIDWKRGNANRVYHCATREDRQPDCGDRFSGDLIHSCTNTEGRLLACEGGEIPGEEGGSAKRFSATVIASPPPPSSSCRSPRSCDGGDGISFPPNNLAVNCSSSLLHPHPQPSPPPSSPTTPTLDRRGLSPTLPCEQAERARPWDWSTRSCVAAALSTHLQAFPPRGTPLEKSRLLGSQEGVGSPTPPQPGTEQNPLVAPTNTPFLEAGRSHVQRERHKDITGVRHSPGFPLTAGQRTATKSDVTKDHRQGQGSGDFFVRGTARVGEEEEGGKSEGERQTGPARQLVPFIIPGEWEGQGQRHTHGDASVGMSNKLGTSTPPADRLSSHVCFSQCSETRERERNVSVMAGKDLTNSPSFDLLDSLQQQLAVFSEDTFYSSDQQSLDESGQLCWYRDHAEASLPHSYSEDRSCVVQSPRSVTLKSETSQWQTQQHTAEISRSGYSSPRDSGEAVEWNADYVSPHRPGSVVSETKEASLSYRHGRVSQVVSAWGRTLCEEGKGKGDGRDGGSVHWPQTIKWQPPVSSSEQEDSDGNYTSISSTESSQHPSESDFLISDSEKEGYDNVDTFGDFVSGLQGQFTSDRPSQHHRSDLITSEFRSSRLRSCIQETILEADDESETADELDTTTTTVSSYRSTFHYCIPHSTPKIEAVSPVPEIRLWSSDQQVTNLSSSDDRTTTVSPVNPLQDLSDKLSSFSDVSFELHTLQDSYTLDDVESRHSVCSSPAPSDVSESSLYSSSATAEVRKQTESATRVKRAESSQTVKVARRNLASAFHLDSHQTARPPASKKAKWIEDNVFLFQKLLNDLESQCKSSEQVLMEEMMSLETGRNGDTSCVGDKASDLSDDLYRSFTQETLEKRQNHVCPFVEEPLPVLRFKRFLKKKHNSKHKGHMTFRLRHRLDKLSELPATLAESCGNNETTDTVAKMEEIFGSKQTFSEMDTTTERPSPSSHHPTSSPTKLHDAVESSIFTEDDADAPRSLSDSAYSTLSDATSHPVSDVSSRGDDVSSVTTDVSMDSDKLASLNDVFDQLDVCEGEVDQALLDRLQVGHYKYKADTL
ncbi:hypothetical protein ACOMHN_021900 [Nucella lapillus]